MTEFGDEFVGIAPVAKDRIRHSTRLSLTRKSGFFADQHCSRYIVGTCCKGEVSIGTNHLGFRCVKDKVDKRADEATTKVLLPKPFTETILTKLLPTLIQHCKKPSEAFKP
jgi:hypothetical protein